MDLGPRSEELKQYQTQITIDNLMLLCHSCHKTIDKDIDETNILQIY